jgi:MFS family permease
MTTAVQQAAAAPVPRPGVGQGPRSGPYLVVLLACLAFAEWVDSFATAFRYAMTTYVREDFGVPLPRMLQVLSLVYVGSFFGFVPRVLADVVGRRLVLWLVTVGLCLLQGLVSYARSPFEYAVVLTLLAVLWKADIWTLVMSEEAPPARRGLFATLPVLIGGAGGITVGLLIQHMGPAPGAWRWVARFPLWGLLLAGPMILVMRETRSFDLQRVTRGRVTVDALLRAPWRGAYARPLVLLIILKLVYLAVATATLALIGTEFLRTVHGFDQSQVGRLVQAQTLAMIVAAVAAGWLSDRIGRLRLGRLAVAGYAAALAALALAPVGSAVAAVCYVLQAFFDAGVLCMLRLVSIETFPRAFRATASGWTDAVPTVCAIGTSWAIGALAGGGVPLSTVILGVAVAVLAVSPLIGRLAETRRADLVEF